MCRFLAEGVLVNVRLQLDEDVAGRLVVPDVQLELSLNNINLELDCLFPRAGRCCPGKYLQSCNTILAKTVLRSAFVPL